MRVSRQDLTLRLLRPREVADILGYTIGYLRKLRWHGGGPPFVVFDDPHTVRYPHDQLIVWMHEREKKAEKRIEKEMFASAVRWSDVSEDPPEATEEECAEAAAAVWALREADLAKMPDEALREEWKRMGREADPMLLAELRRRKFIR